MEPKNVFLSWTGADKDAKDAVKQYLEKKKKITCLDSEERCVGDFMEWSREAARMDGIFLLFLSQNISPTSVVLEEVKEALNTPNAEKRMIPVCDDFDIYKTFMGGVLERKHLSAITAKFKREEEDPEGTKYLEDSLEEIAQKVEYAMESMSFNVYRENRYPKSISLYVGENNSVSFDRLYLDRVITEMENGEEKEKISSPKGLMEKDGLYFLYGAGGSGKSLYIEQIRKEAEDTLVIKLSCAEIANKKKPIYDLMYEEVKEYIGWGRCFTKRNFDGMLCSHRLFLVLDGMDELPTQEARVIFLEKASMFYFSHHKDTGVLFTSRSERDVESVSFGQIRVFRMDPLTDEEIHRLGENVFLETGSEQDQDTFYIRVSDLSDEIRCNPLLLTQLAIIYGQSGEVPGNIVGIFDKVKDFILRTPVGVTPPCEELREENIGGLLKRFAYEKYNHPQKADEKVLAYVLRDNHPDNAKETAAACLKYLKERSIYVEGKFLHKMFLEYFTAVSYYEAIFDDFDDFNDDDKLKELFSHYSDLYWTDMIRLFLIKADNAAEDDALKTLYEEILKGDITEYTLLLDTATKLLRRREITTEAVCLDLLKKSISGEYPAYGPLFWYVPEYGLFDSLVKSAGRMPGDGKALALTRDVCCLNGKYTVKEITDSVDGETLFASGKEELRGTRLALCELFCTGKTEETGEEVYPRLFDVAETKALMTGSCGIFGRREKLFSDELGLYTPAQLPLLGGEYLGFLTLPNIKEAAEAELRKHPCKKVRAVSFTNTEMKTFGYIEFYRLNVKQLYLPENAVELEKYWDNFLTLDREAFFEKNGVWYLDSDREIYIIPNDVTEIGDNAFYGCSSLTEIHLPEGIKEIGEGAFCDCSRLTEIHLPEGLQEIGWKAFEGCNRLTKIHLPDGLQMIERHAFSGCSSLAKIHLPDGLQMIERHAFYGCSSLTEVHLPEGLMWIGEHAFGRCSRLREIHLPEGLREIGSGAFSGCSRLTEIHLPEGLQKIGLTAFAGCVGLKRISLPFSVNLVKLPYDIQIEVRGEQKKMEEKAIPNKSIMGSDITSYSFPEGVETIEKNYFFDCEQLEEVRLPESLKEIGDFAFSDCISLTEIHLPESLQRIKVLAFSGCISLTEIYLPEGLKEIGWRAFQGCSSLARIHLPEGLQKTGDGAFSGCSSLTKIHLPEGLQEIETAAFEDCSSITEIYLPEGVREIGDIAFSRCSSLTEIHLPKGVKKIGGGAFEDCSSLSKIHLPENLQEIEESAFEGCTSLQVIRIPKSVMKIGDEAFINCPSLQEVVLPRNFETEIERIFGGISRNIVEFID